MRCQNFQLGRAIEGSGEPRLLYAHATRLLLAQLNFGFAQTHRADSGLGLAPRKPRQYRLGAKRARHLFLRQRLDRPLPRPIGVAVQEAVALVEGGAAGLC